MSALSKKPTKVISVIAVVAFLAIAGLTTYSVCHLSNRVDEAKISQVNGVPDFWSGIRRSNTVESTTSSVAQDGYISYLVTLANLDSEAPVEVTHIASYVDGEKSGFLPFSTSSLEYSYYPNQPNSWTPVSIASPGYDANGFELASSIHIGNAGSGRNKVYLRYNVAPTTSGVVSDKVAFITKDTSGNNSLAVSDNSIAYEPTSSSDVIASSSQSNYAPSDGDSSEDAFAKPLGATTAGPDTSIIPMSTVGVISLPADNNLLINLVIITSCVGLFIIAMIIYLFIRRRNAAKNRIERAL